MVSPSGLIARYNTRFVCPVSDATMFNFGYFHMQIWFWAVVEENPWVDTSSCDVRDQMRLQTCVRHISLEFKGTYFEMTNLAASVELVQHCAVDDIPEPDMLVLSPPSCRQDTRDMWVPS